MQQIHFTGNLDNENRNTKTFFIIEEYFFIIRSITRNREGNCKFIFHVVLMT